jgi:HSP20 family molecular chaperone IbpA
MKLNTLPISSISLLTLNTVASASAWSCGPGPRVVGNRYSVGCRPNEVCGPSSTDFLLTMPEIQAMLRRDRHHKQRYFYRPYLGEFRTNMDIPFGTSTFPPWKTRSNRKSTPAPESPQYDIIETYSNIQIAIDVPGIEMDNISILLDDHTNVLTVSGSRVQSTAARIGINERDDSTNLPTSSRKFSQKFILKNPAIDINQISASLENGVLTITLPKIPPKANVEEINVRQIPIMSTKSEISSTTTDENSTTNDASNLSMENNHEHNESDSVVAMSEAVEDPTPDDTSDNNTDNPSDSNNSGKDK